VRGCGKKVSEGVCLCVRACMCAWSASQCVHEGGCPVCVPGVPLNVCMRAASSSCCCCCCRLVWCGT
jgi:hypothetical protein